MRAAARCLGHPENRLGTLIHVAGTNGKGGVIAALEAALMAAGLKVQSYRSPYLFEFEENIRHQGKPINPDRCAALFAHVWEVCGHIPLTWFEADTLVALLAFADAAPLTLIECGMGGASDATALVPKPMAAVLTNVGGDHVEFLGSDLQAVAVEKAGIAKGAPLYVPENFDFDVGPVLKVPLAGTHPSLALANAVLKSHFSDVPALHAMPPQLGRWMRLPGDPATLYDVGHNAHAAAFLAARLTAECPGPYVLSLGMLQRKDPAAFLAAFAHLSPLVHPVDLGPDGHAPAAIAALAQSLGLNLWQGEAYGTRLITGSHQTVAKLMPPRASARES